uniref:Uncharacterized protein n=1 Tax=Timema poppense TaxID=170557 RepID=A0A7R9DTV9_TIMPO|nr:unnamed protein product [Timema poppensis]
MDQISRTHVQPEFSMVSGIRHENSTSGPWTLNLATALKSAEPGKEVGLLDADVFGPSIPLMMNLHETPLVNKGLQNII